MKDIGKKATPFFLLTFLGTGLLIYGLIAALKYREPHVASLGWLGHKHEVLAEIIEVSNEIKGNTPAYLNSDEHVYLAGFDTTTFMVVGCFLALIVMVIAVIRLIIRNKNEAATQLMLFKSIINSSDDAIVSKDMNGVIMSWNPGAAAILGYERSEIIGKHISLLISREHIEEENRIADRVRKGNYINQHETQWRRKDGHTITVSLTVSPIKQSDGKIIGACNIARDITTSKEAEEQMIIKEQQSRYMLDLIEDGFILLDKNFCFVYLNKKYGEMMGRPPASLVGKCVWTEFPEIVGSAVYETLQKAMIDQQYVKTIDYYPPLHVWHETHVYPNRSGLFVFIRDITEEKKVEETIRDSERIYKTITSSMPGTIICLFDRDYRYTAVEGALLARFGYTREMLLGSKAQDVLSPERFSAVLPNLVRVFGGESFSTEDLRVGFDTITRYVPFKDEHDIVTSAMLVLIDISEIQNANRKIISMNVDLEQKVAERTEQLALSNKELESFSYSVAHDLRSPLRAIAGYSTMLIEDYTSILDDEGKRLLQMVEKNARKMGVLVDELLAFSKLGRKEIQKTSIDMNGVVAAALNELNVNETQRAMITIHPLHAAMADFSLIKQVLINLISNAVKYSARKERPHVDISSVQRDNEIVYSITDNGVGFDMAYASKLFGVFQRLHSESEFEGTGVGLAIVQRIIHRHDGKVSALGVPGEGATFSFSLPMTVANQ